MENRSLFKLLHINRNSYRLSNSTFPIPQPNPTGGYSLSDFGENAINSHYPFDSIHSNRCQVIFNYIIKDYLHRCTMFESYKTPEAGNYFVDRHKILEVSAALDADIIITPYVDAASYREYEYYDFVLPVGSHYDNAGSDGNSNNSNRHDITPNAETLLINSVAVSARRDVYELFESYTSYGYGMEFFEDISHEAMDSIYPNKDIPTALAAVVSADGITFTSTANPGFTKYINIGDEITIRHNDKPYEVSTVKTINGESSMTLNNALSPISSEGIYAWFNVNLASYCGGQAQSWAVPIVAGKLKIIKMETMKDWDTVRYAARITAKRNPTGVPEIDNVNWDIYRGFGCIDVNAAIQYINNL